MSKSFTKFIGQTVLMSLLLGAPSVAQTAVIDEVIVTTTRSDSLRIDNPGNIATLDPSQTVNLFPVELLNKAPGVHIHRGSGQEHLTAMRSPVLVGGAGAGSFLYLEDGIPMRAPGFANVNALMDAMPQNGGAVAVVRGPGSALYGSNAVHGLVNFISAPLDEAGASADIAVGSYGRHTVKLQSAQDHGAYMTRFSLDLTGDADGYRDEQNFGQQKARLEAAWQDGPTGYRLSVAHMNLNQETAGYAQSLFDLGENPNQGDVDGLPAACQTVPKPAYENEACAKANGNTEAYRDATATRLYVRMTTDLGDGATLTLTPYLRSTDMDFLLHFLSTADPLEQNSHDSYGLQASYARDAGWLSYIAGLDIELTEGNLKETQTNGPDQYFNYLPGTHYDFDVEAQVIAPYVHAVWSLSPATDITTGLRWEMTDYDYTNKIEANRFGKLYRPESQSNDFSDVSPQFGLVHRLADNRRVFANLSRATRAPQVTDLYRLRDDDKTGPLEAPLPDSFDSETLDSLEVGYRAVYPGLSYEATAFLMKKENYHFRDGDDRYETDGETDHMGIELSVDWMLARDWNLTTNLTYAQHEYAFDREVGLVQFGSNPLETITDGNTIDGAPETLATTALRYKYDERTYINAEWEHVGSYYMDASNSEEYDGHNIFAVTADYVISGQSRFSLRIDNLFDEAYAKRADKWFGKNRYFPGEGRRFMARISHDF
ncbi:MAG: TonB-dependent receptor [Alphaproteobacteria bacterium]|nr:TonB-dependent receptor [Alphaproteobacteria bacterium]